MPSQNYQNFQPPAVNADWLNDVNTATYSYCGTALGTANALIVFSPAYFTQLVDSQEFQFFASANNTGSMTIVIESASGTLSPSYPIVNTSGNALSAGNILAGAFYSLVFTGSALQLLTPVSSATSNPIVTYEAAVSGNTYNVSAVGTPRVGSFKALYLDGTRQPSSVFTVSGTTLTYTGSEAISNFSTLAFDFET